MIAKLFDTLANMGIWFRFNDSRTEPPSEEGRAWGAVVDGFALSLAPHGAESVSVLMKYIGETEKNLAIPGWLRFFSIHLTAADGASVPLKPYGQQVLNDPALAKPIERHFAPGKYMATDIPLGALYDFSAAGVYSVRVSCVIPGGSGAALASNEVQIGKAD